MIFIHDKEGPTTSLENRFEQLAEEQPYILGRVLAILIDHCSVNEDFTEDLRDAEVLGKDEFLSSE